jgi:hypothetical protein
VIDVEHALRTLELEFPPTPDVARRVVLAERSRRRVSRPLVLAFAVAALALAAALAVPPARSALLRVLHLESATIERVEGDPAQDRLTSRPLGREVSLDDAKARAGFTVLVPRGDGWKVLYDSRFRGGAVTFGREERRLWLTELVGEGTPYVEKSIGRGTSVIYAEVRGGPGYWLEGDRHRVVFRAGGGDVLESRAAGNVLIWEEGPVLLRLEGARSLEEARRIAGTLRAEPV